MFLCFYFIDKNIDTIPPLTLTMLYEADQDDSGGSRKGKPGWFLQNDIDKTIVFKVESSSKDT